MRIYVDIYDHNGEWQDTLECPLDNDILLEDYGEDYTLDGWKCEYDYITPILRKTSLDIANELSAYEPKDLLWVYYDNCPDYIIYPMWQLNEIVNIEGKELTEILGMFKNFSMSDDYFAFDGYGNIYSLTSKEAREEEEIRIIDMVCSLIG